MNFAALRYFNEVAETKAIRRAADRLHVAPSAVSRQLGQLEHAIGAPLLERTNTGIALTPAGEILEDYTRRLFRDLERVKQDIAAYRSLSTGTVKIHAMEGVLVNFLPRLIARFGARHPGITYQVVTRSSDLIVEALIRDETDIGITYNAFLRPEIEIVAERADPVMCLVAAADPLANAVAVSLDDLCQRRLALPPRNFGLRQLFESAVEARGLAPQRVIEANNLDMLRAMAITGSSITIGPVLAAAREIEAGQLVAIPIDVPTFLLVRSSVCIHRDRRLSFAAKEFLKTLRDTFDRVDGEVWS